VPALSKPKATTEGNLLKEFIPNMLYSRKDPRAFEAAAKEFRVFMKKYRFQEDIEAIVSIIKGSGELTENKNRLLELYASKIACVEKEDFTKAEEASREIQRLRENR
jgi:hypothetical protein